MGNRNVTSHGFSKGYDHDNLGKMTEKQLAVFTALTDPQYYGKTMGEKAKACGVTRNYCYYMMAQDWFVDLVNERVNALIDKHLFEIYQVSFNQARKPGGFSDRKMLLEMHDKHSQDSTIDEQKMRKVKADADIAEWKAGELTGKNKVDDKTVLVDDIGGNDDEDD